MMHADVKNNLFYYKQSFASYLWHLTSLCIGLDFAMGGIWN